MYFHYTKSMNSNWITGHLISNITCPVTTTTVLNLNFTLLISLVCNARECKKKKLLKLLIKFHL